MASWPGRRRPRRLPPHALRTRASRTGSASTAGRRWRPRWRRRRRARSSSALLLPGIPQRDGAVVDRLSRTMQRAVGDEVAVAFELKALLRRSGEQGGFRPGAGNAARVGIQVEQKIALSGPRLGNGEQPVVQAHFDASGMADAKPVDVALHLALF